MVAQRESSKSLGTVLRTEVQEIQDFARGIVSVSGTGSGISVTMTCPKSSNGKFDVTLLRARWNYK